MLAELSIKNFAIIESISLSFKKGLTVLTGETGAGKSIIIDAISLLAGGRGSAEFVRFGAEKAELEGLFLIDSNQHPSLQKCLEFGIDTSDNMIVLRRAISENGKSICRINGKLVTISILREVGSTLIDIHGQHEHQDLMNEERHLHFLDQFDPDAVNTASFEYETLFKKYKSLKKRLDELNENEQQLAHRLDLIQFQLDEIKKAKLEPNEDEKLLEEKLQLSNYDKIFRALGDSYEALLGEQKALDWVGLAMSNLEEVASINETLNKLHETVTNSYFLLEEAASSIRNEWEALEFDPNHLQLIEKRLNEISFLQKKYGKTVNDILEYGSEIEDEIDKLNFREQHIEKYKKELSDIEDDLLLEAKHLSEIRRQISHELTDAIQRELKQLYMEKTVFTVNFKENYPLKFDKKGIDDVEFLISTNPGEPLKPLSKVASGGELSRIMLALKSIFSKHQGITSIIFDEVDTGVSGRVAQAIGEKIHNVSVGSQVLCITHLPQVAAMADTHLYISKETKGERTKTSVKPLKNDEQIEEIGRMISGTEITQLTKDHARELIDMAQEIKTGVEKKHLPL